MERNYKDQPKRFFGNGEFHVEVFRYEVGGVPFYGYELSHAKLPTEYNYAGHRDRRVLLSYLELLLGK